MLRMYIQGMMERFIMLKTGDSAILGTQQEGESVDSGVVSNKLLLAVV